MNAIPLGPLCAFLASVTWAVGSATYSRIARGHSAFAVNFSRACVALPLFILASILSLGGATQALHAFVEVPPGQILWLAISIFASYGLGDVFFMWSTRSLGVPAALAIGSTYPLLTAGAAAVIQGERLGLHQLLGLLITVSGVALVILYGAPATPPSGEGAHASPSHLTRKGVGVALAFATTVMWALNSFCTSRGGHALNPAIGNVYRMAFGLLMSFGFGRALAPKTEFALPTKVLRKSLGIFVFEAFGGSLFFMYGLSHSPLAIGSTLASLAPVLSVPVAWFLGLEKFSVIRTLGVCLVVFGLWLLMNVF